MFGLQINTSLPYFGIYKKIQEGKAPEFFPVLNVEFCQQRIVGIHIVFGEIFKGHPGLQVHGLLEYMTGEIKGISGDQAGDIQHIAGLVHFLVQQCIHQ